MAHVDTGLGWLAESEWLLQTTGQIAAIADIVGPEGSSVPYLGENPSGADVYISGRHFYHTPDLNWDVYIASLSSDHLFLVLVGTQPYLLKSVSEGDSVDFIQAVVDSGGTVRSTSISRDGHFVDQTGGVYYSTIATSYPNPTFFIPQFSSIAEAVAEVNIQLTRIYKDNPGYAVACIAKWHPAEQTTISTPILISSITENTDMTEDSGQYNLAKLNVLRDGIRFYMSFFDIPGTPNINSPLPVVDLTEDGPRTLEQLFTTIADLDHAAIIVNNSPDPYQGEAGSSEEEGGDGEELDDDPVEEETLPVPSVTGHGFCTIYVPSSQELGQMASYLWSGAFDVDQVIKLFSNPMDSILGLSAVPVSLSGTSEQIYLGGVALTGITMPKYTGRTSVKVDFGTVTVKERWGSYLDYAPYTDFSIYLPFIGIKPVKADDIMGKTISLMYAIDILSGGCVAYLRPAGGSVLYEWSGQCAVQIPVTGRSYDNVFQSAMSVATATLAAVAAPASAPVLSGAVASAAVQAAASKPHIERSGTVNGITGYLGQLRPYLIRTIPEAYIPADQNKFIGYPAYINVDLATVKGYNEVDSIHLENVTATGAELDEIETILKGGVIF